MKRHLGLSLVCWLVASPALAQVYTSSPPGADVSALQAQINAANANAAAAVAAAQAAQTAASTAQSSANSAQSAATAAQTTATGAATTAGTAQSTAASALSAAAALQPVKSTTIPTSGPGAGLCRDTVVPSALVSSGGVASVTGACARIMQCGTSATYVIEQMDVGSGC